MDENKLIFEPVDNRDGIIKKEFRSDNSDIDKRKYFRRYVIEGTNKDTGNVTKYQIKGRVFPTVPNVCWEIGDDISYEDLDVMYKAIPENVDLEIYEIWIPYKKTT